MTTWIRRAGAALAALTLAAAGMIAVPAVASAGNDKPDTFTIRNLTPYPLVTTQVRVIGDQNWSWTFQDRFPYPGQIIQPGQEFAWDLGFQYNGPAGVINPNQAWIDYTIGAGGPAVHVMAYNNGKGWPFHQTDFNCTSDAGGWACAHSATFAQVIAATPHDTVVPASDGQQQAQLMQLLCHPDNPNLLCRFAQPPKQLEQVTMPYQPLGDAQYNYTSGPSEHSWTQEWESGTSYKIGGSYSPVDIDVEKVVKVEVKVTFDHEWGTSHAETVTNGVDIEPGHVGWIEAQIPAQQVTGDLRVQIGNNSWTLTGVTFATPAPNATGSFDWTPRGRMREMTPAEQAAVPPTS